MERAVFIVCRPEVARGFELAGIVALEAPTPEERAARVARLIDEPEGEEAGLILVDDDAYALFPSELRAELARRALPMVVPIPSPSWGGATGAAEAYVAEVLGRAAGYRVRLR